MNDVKRYSKTYNGGLSWDVQEAPDGEYVIYDDYAALRARLEAMEKERDEALGWRTVAENNQAMAQSWQARAERAEAALVTARRDALEEAANLNGWWLVMNAHGEPDGTYCSVQPSGEPSAIKYVSAAAIRALIDKDATP